MPLVTLQNLSIGYTGKSLFDNVNCQINEGERIGLLGRNGVGKTTLMRMLMREEQPDDGEINIAAGVRIALLQQDVPSDLNQTVQETVAEGVLTTDLDAQAGQDWKRDNMVDQILSRMDLDPTAQVGQMSSGMKRRVLLAKALVCQPDLLLLDEPTNHLDIQAIDWLENFLIKCNASLMFVTHDRVFLQNVANRILEIDRGQVFDWSCDYQTFLQRKEQALAAEEKQNALFDKRLAEEEAWIRRGIKARRTRNEGRVRALKALRIERQDRREKTGTSNLKIQEGGKSGMLVAEVEGLSFQYENRPIVNNFSTAIMRGDKIGIIGPNGIGKTTFLKLVLGKLKPSQGKVRLGTNLQIAYFDQLRQTLDPDATVQENVGDGYDHIEINGAKKHILGYLQDFLFTPERARTRIKFLSGGERNRILLAKLFAKPANVIVLDEPTNDLDYETLEMLEEKLVEFSGTVLVVSHDRAFLNNVVTSTLVFENDNVKEYVGGYDDWIRQRTDPGPVASQKIEKPKKSGRSKPAKKAAKLSFNEKRELEQLPEKIEVLESQIAELHQLMGDPDFYQHDGGMIAEKQAQLKTLDESLAEAYQRWETLEELSSAG